MLFNYLYSMVFEMRKENGNITKESKTISLNNAQKVLEVFSSGDVSAYEDFLTMLHGNSFNGVNITEANINNNSRFVVDLWD